jgi:hypothetical protein
MIVASPITKPQIVLVRRHHGRSAGADSVTVAGADPLDWAAVTLTLARFEFVTTTLTAF